MSQILVTGATGFVGRRLCHLASEQGHRVIAAVRQARPEHAALKAAEVVETGDLCPETAWDAALFDGTDAVIHLAARVHQMQETAADPEREYQRMNTGATLTLARACAGQVRRFVYVSSIHSMRTLWPERLTEQSACAPDSPYGRSKLDAEQALTELARETGLEVTILRPPPVFGPGQVGRLLTMFRAVQQGLPLPRLACRRSLIYVDNLADALIQCAVHPAAAGKTYLVSDGEEVSLAELLQRMGRAFGRKTWLVPAPASLIRTVARLTGRSTTAERLLGSLTVDSSRIQQELDWQPPFSLDDGLAATAAWMKQAN